MNANIVEFLRRNAEAHSGKAALALGSEVVTYGELWKTVQGGAAYLRKKGIKKGDGVLVVAPVSISLYALLASIFHVGAVAVFVDAWSDRRRIEHARSLVPIRAFAGSGIARWARLFSPALRSIPLSLQIDPKAWRRSGEADAGIAHVDPDDSALVTFTSGTTGDPKGADRTHGFLRAQHEAIVRYFGITAEDRDLATLPIFPLSNLALGATTLLPTIAGHKLTDFDPASMIAEMNRYRITTTTGSPAFLSAIAKHLLAGHRPAPSLERVFVGGAPLYPELAKNLREAFSGDEGKDVRVTVVYGATEAEPISTIDLDDYLARIVADGRSGLPVGRPVDSIRVLIAPLEGTARGVGEICVAGEHVLRRYIGDAESSSEKFFEQDGTRWLRTGDAGYVEENGELRLLGRVSRSILTTYGRIFPIPVELLCDEMPGIGAGTILMTKGMPTVVVQPKGGASPHLQDVLEKLYRHGIPAERIALVPRIPRDPRHESRIDYAKLEKMVNRK